VGIYQKKAHEIEKPLVEEDNSTHRVKTETDKHELKSSLDELLSRKIIEKFVAPIYI
jgi:hypothetical protein